MAPDVSATIGNGRCWCSPKARWLASSSRDTAKMVTPAFTNLSNASRKAHASLVQPGVSSFG